MSSKVNRVLKNVATGLAFGLKNTEDIILTQKDQLDSSGGINQHQVVEEERLSKALLKGEITRQVKELRYRTYNTADEAQKFMYYGNGIATKLDYKVDKLPPVEQSDGYTVKIVQTNESLSKTILDELENVGTYGQDQDFIVKIERKCYPKFKLERFMTKIVVKIVDNDNVQLDLYVSKYPKQFEERLSKAFLSEIKEIQNGYTRSDIIEFDNIWFVTKNAYGSLNMRRYKFDNIKYKEITEFDGSYVIKFWAKVVESGTNLVDQYYDAIMANKYASKEPNDINFSLDEKSSQRVRTCSMCGEMINSFDGDLTEETLGISLCPSCLAKEMRENESFKKQSGIFEVGEITSNHVEPSEAYLNLKLKDN